MINNLEEFNLIFNKLKSPLELTIENNFIYPKNGELTVNDIPNDIKYIKLSKTYITILFKLYYKINKFIDYKNKVFIENKILNFYSYKGDRIINISLRDNKLTTLSAFVIDGISNLIDISLNFENEVFLFRGISGNYAQNILNMEVGREITFPGFNSMTYDFDIAKDFSQDKIILKINFKSKTKFIYFNRDENEILTYSNIKCKIIDKYKFNNEYKIIELEVVDYVQLKYNLLFNFDQKFLNLLFYLSTIINFNDDLYELLMNWPSLYLNCLIKSDYFDSLNIEYYYLYDKTKNIIENFNIAIKLIINNFNYDFLIRNKYMLTNTNLLEYDYIFITNSNIKSNDMTMNMPIIEFNKYLKYFNNNSQLIPLFNQF